jgi:hypothetical protein
MGNNTKVSHLTADEIPWALPAIDPLTVSDSEAELADTLRLALMHVAALTTRCDRATAIVISLRTQLRDAHAETAAVRRQLDAYRECAA